MVSYRTLIKPLIIFVGIVVIGVAGWFLLSRGCGDQPAQPVKEGWVAPPTEKPSTLFDRLNPLKKTPTPADKILKGWPAGTRVVEVGPSPKPTLIAVPPSGEILTPKGTVNVTVYEKPKRNWGLEFRPFVGVGATGPDINVAAVAGVDVFKVSRLHTGPGVCVDSKAVSGVMTASYGLWRNVDVRVGGGYGTAGGMGFAGVSIGIE